MHIIVCILKANELTHPVDPAADAISLDVSILRNSYMLAIFDPRGDPRISFVGGIAPLAEVIRDVDNGLGSVHYAAGQAGHRCGRCGTHHASEVDMVRAETALRHGHPRDPLIFG